MNLYEKLKDCLFSAFCAFFLSFCLLFQEKAISLQAQTRKKKFQTQ